MREPFDGVDETHARFLTAKLRQKTKKSVDANRHQAPGTWKKQQHQALRMTQHTLGSDNTQTLGAEIPDFELGFGMPGRLEK